MNFKIGTPMEHALYRLPQPAIKACEVGFLHAGGGIACRPHPAATQLVSANFVIVIGYEYS